MNSFLKLIWNKFIYGGHLLPLGAVSLVFTSAILLGIKITWDCLVVVFLGMEAAYLYNRYKELKIDFLTNPERSVYLEKNIKYIPFIIFFYSILTVGLLIYFNKPKVMIFGLTLFLISLLYSVFLKKLTNRIIGFKDFFIGLIWAFVVVFLALYYYSPLNLSLFLVFIFICLRVFIGTSFYDIKDIESDKKEKLLSLVIVLGKNKLILLLKTINILSLIPIGIGVFLKIFPLSGLMLFFLIPLAFYFFKKLEKEKVNIAYLSEIAIGVEKISWSILILIGSLLL